MSYIYDLTDTWNNVATTFNAIKMNVTDTASAAGSLLMNLQVGGTSRFSVSKAGLATFASDVQAGTFTTSSSNTTFLSSTNGLFLGASRSISWRADDASGSADTVITRDAANTLAQRNSTNAQAFRLYNTFTDASNYERGQFAYSSNILIIGHENAGTGASRAVQIRAGSSHGVSLCSQSTVFWQATSSGHWFAGTDNTYDIGASGANRPRHLFLGGNVEVAAGGGAYLTAGRGGFRMSTDGTMLLMNTAGTDFGRLQFGGTTSSFPSLKRNGTALETKLADDSAYAPHAMQYLDVTDGITAPAAATGRARIYVDTADGDLKVIFADGTIKTIVTDT